MKYRKDKSFKLVVGLIIATFIIGCSHQLTTREVAFKTLSAAATSYEQTMTVLGDYYRQGKISEDTKDKIVAAGDVYWGAYHSAVIAFEVYERSNQIDGNADKAKLKADMDVALNELNMALLEFLQIADDYMHRLKKIDNKE